MVRRLVENEELRLKVHGAGDGGLQVDDHMFDELFCLRENELAFGLHPGASVAVPLLNGLPECLGRR